jgi:protein-tyrosine phosphatase
MHAKGRGYDLSTLRARQILDVDFEQHDLILAMDWDNLALVQEQCPKQHQSKVRRLMEFRMRQQGEVVPDPYYGGEQGFEHVLDLVEDGCDGLLLHVQRLIA